YSIEIKFIYLILFMLNMGVDELTKLAEEGRYYKLRKAIRNGHKAMGQEDKLDLLNSFTGIEPKWYNRGSYHSCVFFLTGDLSIIEDLVRTRHYAAADVVVRDYRTNSSKEEIMKKGQTALHADDLKKLGKLAESVGARPGLGMNYSQLLDACKPPVVYDTSDYDIQKKTAPEATPETAQEKP
ncbi:hypothetical protein ACFL96_19760, partial [Thermoproteota archaeon]